jgi:hypothetical protein
VFYYPFTALTYLFMRVVDEPLAASAHHDMALIDMVIGLFARLEFVSSGMMTVPKVGEFSRMARDVVTQAERVQAERAQAAGIGDVSLHRLHNHGHHSFIQLLGSNSPSNSRIIDGSTTEVFSAGPQFGAKSHADSLIQVVHHTGYGSYNDKDPGSGALPSPEHLFQPPSSHRAEHNNLVTGHQPVGAYETNWPAAPDVSDIPLMQNFDWSSLFSEGFVPDATSSSQMNIDADQQLLL